MNKQHVMDLEFFFFPAYFWYFVSVFQSTKTNSSLIYILNYNFTNEFISDFHVESIIIKRIATETVSNRFFEIRNEITVFEGENKSKRHYLDRIEFFFSLLNLDSNWSIDITNNVLYHKIKNTHTVLNVFSAQKSSQFNNNNNNERKMIIYNWIQ